MAPRTGYHPTPTNPIADVRPATERPASDDTDAVLDDIDTVLAEGDALEVLRSPGSGGVRA